MKTILSLFIIVLSIIGLSDAGYITYHEVTNQQVICGGSFDCGGVLDSPWAKIGPVPLSAVGMVYYSMILIIGIFYFLNFDIRKWSRPLFKNSKLNDPTKKLIINATTSDLLQTLTFAGFGFSIYLVFIMAFLIKAWCLYCLISALTSTLLFITATLLHNFPALNKFIKKFNSN